MKTTIVFGLWLQAVLIPPVQIQGTNTNHDKDDQVLSAASHHGLSQMIDSLTRVTSSTATPNDLVFVMDEDNVIDRGELPDSITDHDLVYYGVRFKPLNLGTQNQTLKTVVVVGSSRSALNFHGQPSSRLLMLTLRGSSFIHF